MKNASAAFGYLNIWRTVFLFFLFLPFVSFAQIKNETQLISDQSSKSPQLNTWEVSKIVKNSDRSSGSVSSDLVQASIGNEVNLSFEEKLKAQGAKEDVSKRDTNSKHFLNPDGTYTAIITAGPVHYFNNGSWEDIKTEITQTSNSSYPYINKTNLLESHFGKKVSDGVISKTDAGQVKEFLNTKMYWEVNGQISDLKHGVNVNAQKEGDKVFYRNIYGDIDAEFTVLIGKRKLNYIVPKKESLGEIPFGADFLVFSEDIQIPQGWTYFINEKKDVEIKDVSGKTVLIYARPFVMEDYQADAGLEELDESISFFEVSQVGNLLKVLTKVKTTWLLDEQRVFPIAVDPTVSPNNTTYWTGYARSNGNGGDNFVRVGYTGNVLASYPTLGYSKFNLSSIPDDSSLLSVNSSFYFYDRNGNLNNGQSFAIVNIPLDPVPASYLDIFYSPTQFISSDYYEWNSNPPTNQWYDNNFSNAGIAYVQDAIQQNYVAIGLYSLDYSDWSHLNYAGFRGYNNNNRPRLTINYTTTCSTPASIASSYYLTNVSFVGTLNPDTNNPSGYSAGGYGNFTGLTNKAKQIPGGVINAKIKSINSAHVKAWVDWNKDGLFDSTEKVFDTGSIITSSTIFGFVVPAGTAVGNYNIRIRTHYDTSYYLACGSLSNGETEDYSFEVIADCSAKITAVNIDPEHGHRCGTGEVTLSATGTAASYRWYTSEFGGTAIPGANSSTYTTPSISATTTYYVTAYNGGCESVYRTPVVARIDPTPEIEFDVEAPEICGVDTSITITSSGDVEEETILDEKFNSGLGAFQNTHGGNTNTDAAWQNRTSPYIPTKPPYFVMSPAITSGYSGGSYACSITDVMQNSDILNYLQQSGTVDASELLDLKLDFDFYYATMLVDDLDYEYFVVEASPDGGTNWNTIATITTDQGNPAVWSKHSYSLDSDIYLVSNLKIRFGLFSYGETIGSSTYWIGNIAAVDNVRLYGNKPLDTNFDWTGDTSVIYDENCIDPYSGASTTVCIKPTDFETNETWTINATATLSNGCSASGSIEVDNNNKVWNTASSDWASLNWKPGTAVPTADNCVIIRTPVNIPGTTDGVAKNLKVETGGSLTIQSGGSLTLTDFLNNEGTASAFIVESDANLLQIDPGAVNTGNITVKRTANVPSNQYNYWASPVKNQVLYSLYDNGLIVPTDRVMVYNPETDYFAILKKIDNPLSEFGKGYSIKGPASNPSGNVTAKFVGTPNNESSISTQNQITVATFTTDGDDNNFNLIGNPFPSNLDLVKMYDKDNVYGTGNAAKFETADVYFWDNVSNTETTQQGSGYNQSNYAIFNMASETGYKAPCNSETCGGTGSGKKPNGIVKPGQGFIVNIAQGGTSLTVNNDMRTKETLKAGDEAVYYKNGNLLEANDTHKRDDRFWLELISPNDLHIQTAVGYFERAENTFEVYDSKILSESVSENIYTISHDNVKLAIQGRKGIFHDDDEIPLVVKLFEEGRYKIQLEETKGIFISYQNIYLKDKLMNIIYNLSEDGAYEFEADAGVHNERFEIVFKDGTSAGPVLTAASQVHIQKINHQIQITSSRDKLVEVEIFNLTGRSVYKNASINAKEFRIPIKSFENQIIVVKVQTETGEIVTKKLVN